MKTVKTVCLRDCPDTCFMDVSVENGTIIKTRGSRENPVTGGFLCPRGNGDPRRVTSPRRVLYPHARSSAGGASSYARIAWDAALDAVAEKIRTTIDTHGNESVLLYDYAGNTGLLAWHFPKRLWAALGATTTDYALCSRSGHAGIGLHYGLSYGLSLEEVAASEAIFFWGFNAKINAPHIWAWSNGQKRNAIASLLVSIPDRALPRKHPIAGSVRIREAMWRCATASPGT